MKYDLFQFPSGGGFSPLFSKRFRFLTGDQPSAATFTNWAKQDAFAIDVIASLIGDLRGAGVDSTQTTGLGKLYFTNLSRSLGNLALTSAWMPTRSISGQPVSFIFEQDLVPMNTTQVETQLYFPRDLADGGIPAITQSGTPWGTNKTSKEALAASGDFYLEGNILYTKDPLPAGLRIEYNAVQWDGMELDGSSPTLIPSVAQCLVSVAGTSGLLCNVRGTGVVDGYTEYTLTLPRIRFLLYKGFLEEGNLLTTYTRENRYRILVIPDQPVSYTLPDWMTTDLGADYNGTDLDLEKSQGMTADAILPHGSVMLWNMKLDQPAAYPVSSDTFGVDELEYRYLTQYTIQIRVPGEGKLVKEISSGTVSYLNVGEETTDHFALILKGSDLSREVFSIKETLRRKSNLPYRGGPILDHRYIGNCFRPGISTSPSETGHVGINRYFPSRITGNYHPQYVERSGYVSASDAYNKDNAHLGDFCIAGDGDTYASAVGPYVDSGAETLGSFRFFWSNLSGLFNQYRYNTDFNFNGSTLSGYQTLHMGSGNSGSGHNIRLDLHTGSGNYFANISAGDQLATRSTDQAMITDIRLTLWRLNGTTPTSLRGLPTTAHALELTKGYNNQTTTDNGYFVGRGFRWLDLPGGEAGGWSFANGVGQSFIYSAGHTANGGKVITNFSAAIFSDASGSTDGVLYTYGHLVAGDATKLVNILYRPATTRRLQFGNFVHFGAFGSTQVGNGALYSKFFGVYDTGFSPGADPSPGITAHYDIQMLGHWAFRGNLSGGNTVKLGAYRSHWAGSPALFYVGLAELAINGGAATSITDGFRVGVATWEDLAYWRLDPLGNFNTKGEITTSKVVKARYFAGEASRVQRPIIKTTTISGYGDGFPQPVVKTTTVMFNFTSTADHAWEFASDPSNTVPDAWTGNIACVWLPISIKAMLLLPTTSVLAIDQVPIGGPGSTLFLHQIPVMAVIRKAGGGIPGYYSPGDGYNLAVRTGQGPVLNTAILSADADTRFDPGKTITAVVNIEWQMFTLTELATPEIDAD